MAVGTHFRKARGRFTRIPIRKTTNGSSISAVNLPGITRDMRADLLQRYCVAQVPMVPRNQGPAHHPNGCFCSTLKRLPPAAPGRACLRSVGCDVIGAIEFELRSVRVELAKRMERLGTETAFSVLAKAKALEAQGREIIHLEIGEPDFDTPSHIVEAGCRALRDGHTHYPPTAGIPELREAIAYDVAESRDIEVGPEQVVITPGGKPIMFFAILALVDEGDEVMLPNPAFPIYESMVNFVGGMPIFLPLRQGNGFRFDLDEFRAGLSERSRLVILNSPANPTGGVLTADDIAGLAAILRERPDVYVLSDEIYSRLLYADEFASIASEPGLGPDGRTIILDGFSKTYAMTGWRLGYGVMPEPLAEEVAK